MITVKIVLLIKIIFNLLLKTITIYNIINKSRAISSGDRVADFESVRRGFESLMAHRLHTKTLKRFINLLSVFYISSHNLNDMLK